jgi:20S proteasome alpha/beta subunit
MDPLWNSLVVGGLQTDKDGQLKPFLGFLGMIGTSYEDAHVATGEHATQHQSILIVYELRTHRLA